MKSILFSMVLFAFVSLNAQQITIDTSWTSDEPGVIERYWHWAAGVNVVGEDFTPNSEVTITSADENGFAWREFTVTSDANGGFEIYVNAMKLNSIIGTYTATATDASNLEATATYNVIPNIDEVLVATASQSEITMNDLHYGTGIVVTATGFAPNAEVKINLGSPSAGGMEVDPTGAKFADANGVFTLTLDGTTQVGTMAAVYPIPQIPGIWDVSFHDFSGNNYTGSTSFRVLPDNPGEYCIPTVTFEVEPISKVEFSNISKSSSLTSTQGYEDFTDEVANVNAGETYTIKLQGKAKWDWNVNTYTVFIDWNQNGIMDEEGEVYSAGYLLGSTGEDGQTVEYDITIPENALNGETRMRVLKVYSPSSTAMFWPSGACGDYNYGQIEDYTVNISGGVMGISEIENQKINFYPNPVKDVLNISDAKTISSIAVFDLSGKQVYTQNVNSKQTQINVSNLATGIYIVKANVNGEVKTFKIVKK